MAWLRLTAGKAMLKIWEQKSVGYQYTKAEFHTLSKLIVDPVMKVRELFVEKLHKGLGKRIPEKCLPLDFMGLYALGGLETDAKLQQKIQKFLEIDINCRREYLKTFALGNLKWFWFIN